MRQTTSSPTITNTGAPARLPVETRTLLRTLGSVAIKLAEDDTVDPKWLHHQTAGLPGNHPIGHSPDLLTIPETCARLRLSRWSVYQLIHRRELATVKIGRRRFVPATEVDRFIGQLTEGGGSR
ncbi:helix-turn-helix domain-containing protein [Nocardia brasiliensis]|uniref:helix-turn-helix domain-containing protein n=1 Tax=Nocardia brasiliensis TaxID=37326 RepID=UPI002454827C|nr:helix-turn-helix domain-containing protein [Nocardia brasiliensis]